MDKELACKVVEFICNSYTKHDGVLSLDFHGGEPLMQFGVMKFLIEKLDQRFPELEKNYCLTTNATLLNDERIQYITKHIKNVSVSLDGSKEKHDRNRIFANGRGSYDVALKNSLKLLLILGERLRVRMTLGPDTVKGVSKDLIELYQLGFKTLAVLPDIFCENWENSDFDLLKEELRIAKESISDNTIYFNLIEPLVVQKKAKCSGGIDEIQIYPDGSLYPCSMSAGMEEFKIGDIFKGVDEEKRDEILHYSNECMDSCKDCDMHQYCESNRCRIVNKITMNNYLIPNAVQCLFNNTLMEENGYILR